MSGQTACVKLENMKNNHMNTVHTYYSVFGSIPALNALDDAAPPGEGRFTLLNPLI